MISAGTLLARSLPFVFLLPLLIACDNDTSTPVNGESGEGIPRVFTNLISNITDTSAVSGGFVSDDGGSEVTDRGVCWDTQPQPSLEDHCLSDGGGMGNFITMLTGLTPLTTYYVRAYATNSLGTAYGTQRVFETEQDVDHSPRDRISHGYVSGVSPSQDPGFSDRSYPVVRADWPGVGGQQRWMAMNVGATIEPASPNDTREETLGWMFQFNRSIGFVFQGGEATPADLWAFSVNVNSDWTTADPCRLLFGDPWRLPTEEEWLAFRVAPVERGGMGGGTLQDAFNSTLRLHAAGIVHYNDQNQYVVGEHGYYWSKTQESVLQGRAILFDSSFSAILPGNKAYGMPVRCIEDIQSEIE